MKTHMSMKRLRWPGRSLSPVAGRSALPGLLPLPLLHVFGGTGGIWDEIITFALLGGILAALAFAVLGLRGKKEDKGDDD